MHFFSESPNLALSQSYEESTLRVIQRYTRPDIEATDIHEMILSYLYPTDARLSFCTFKFPTDDFPLLPYFFFIL